MKILGNAEHKILFGDVLEALNNIEDESVIEIQEEYVKIGLRRLQLATEYNGEKLVKHKK